MAKVRLEGHEQFVLTTDELAAKLSDTTFLAGCVPEAEVLETTANHVAFRLEPSISLLPGRLQVEVNVAVREAARTHYLIRSRATGASAATEVRMTYEELAPGAATACWIVEVVEVTGLLRLMPGTVLRSGMERAVPRIWSRIRESLGQ